METKTSLVLILAGAIGLGTCAKIMKNEIKRAEYNESLVPQRVMKINNEVAELGNSRLKDIKVSEIEQKAIMYESLVNERDVIYSSDSEIKTAVEYLNKGASTGYVLFTIGLFTSGVSAAGAGTFGLIKNLIKRESS